MFPEYQDYMKTLPPNASVEEILEEGAQQRERLNAIRQGTAQ